MFLFLSVVTICATIVFLAIKQPAIKLEIMHKQEPTYVPIDKPIEVDTEKEQSVDELAEMLGDITDLFTGGDRVNEETTR